MASTSERALLLLSLLSSRPRSSEALAERLGVSTRTVRRDVEALRALGYPVRAAHGRGGSYRLGPAELPPLLLDEQQAIAVALALQTAPTLITGVGEAAARALTTLRTSLPPRLRAEVDDVRVTSVRNVWELRAPALDAATASLVGAAVRRSHLLRFEQLRADGQRPEPVDADFRKLTVEPHELVVWAGRWYLVAFDVQAWEWSVNRLDRIRAGDATNVPFVRRPLPDPDVGRYVMTRPDRGDTPGGWQCTGSAVLGLPAAIVARWTPGGSVVEPVSDGACRLTLSGWSWVGLAGLLASFDAVVSDAEPAALRDAMTTVAQRFTDPAAPQR